MVKLGGYHFLFCCLLDCLTARMQKAVETNRKWHPPTLAVEYAAVLCVSVPGNEHGRMRM